MAMVTRILQSVLHIVHLGDFPKTNCILRFVFTHHIFHPNKRNETADSGAVYIYHNIGPSLEFDKPVILRTEYDLNCRFGMTLSKIGDINQDGFNGKVIK